MRSWDIVHSQPPNVHGTMTVHPSKLGGPTGCRPLGRKKKTILIYPLAVVTLVTSPSPSTCFSLT
jgi:hypothetical protein